MTLITTVNLNFMILFFIYCKSRVMPLVMAGSRVCLHFYSTCISVRRVHGFSDTKACTNVSGKYERSSYITGKACVLSPSQFLPLPPSRPPPHPPFAIFLLPLLVPNPPSSLVSLSSSFSLSPSSSPYSRFYFPLPPFLAPPLSLFLRRLFSFLTSPSSQFSP